MVRMLMYTFSRDTELPYLPRKDVKYGLVVIVNIPSVQLVSGMLSKASKKLVESVSQLELGMRD